MVDLVKVVALVLGVVIVSAGVVGLALGGTDLLYGSAREEEWVPTATLEPTRQASIPPIDATAPAEVKTATFALG
jgi:hypothetical protein